MYIRFYDTGETFKIIGERRQFWLFRQTESQVGRAVKGADSYELISETDDMEIPAEEIIPPDILIREEMNEEEYEEQFNSSDNGD